jgi:hypothetical protein
MWNCKVKVSINLTNEALRHEDTCESLCTDPCVLDLEIFGGEWSASSPGRFIHKERALDIHWIRGSVDLRSGLVDVVKRKVLTLAGLELGVKTIKANHEK